MSRALTPAKKALQALAESRNFSRIDISEILARREIPKIIAAARDLALDIAVEPETRLKAMIFLTERAYGKATQVIRLPDSTESDPIVEADILRAQDGAEAAAEWALFSSRPPSEWPEHLRRAARNLEAESNREILRAAPEKP